MANLCKPAQSLFPPNHTLHSIASPCPWSERGHRHVRRSLTPPSPQHNPRQSTTSHFIGLAPLLHQIRKNSWSAYLYQTWKHKLLILQCFGLMSVTGLCFLWCCEAIASQQWKAGLRNVLNISSYSSCRTNSYKKKIKKVEGWKKRGTDCSWKFCRRKFWLVFTIISLLYILSLFLFLVPFFIYIFLNSETFIPLFFTNF